MMIRIKGLEATPMKSAPTGRISGRIWIILFVIIGGFLLPLGFAVGSMTAESDQAIAEVGPIICPPYTTPILSPLDSEGHPIEGTARDLWCETGDAIVKDDPIIFRLLWEGMLTGITLLITMVMSISLAEPGGVLIGKVLKPKQKSEG
jgi:hypothetical protein